MTSSPDDPERLGSSAEQIAASDDAAVTPKHVGNSFRTLARQIVTRGGLRFVIQQDYGDSYNYAPRERYIESRGYYDGGYYNNGPSVGIGVGPGGVGLGPRW